MNARQESVPVVYRLLAGASSWVPIMLIPHWVGDVAYEVRSALLLGAFAAVGVVFLVPVLARGDWVQRALAAVLLVLPVFQLVSAFDIVVGCYY